MVYAKSCRPLRTASSRVDVHRYIFRRVYCFLSTIDKTIKLWKVYEKAMLSISNLNGRDNDGELVPRKIIRDAVDIRVPEVLCAVRVLNDSRTCTSPLGGFV